MPLTPHARALEYCTYCPKLCRHSCPVSNALGRETLIPQAKMHLLDMMRKSAIPWHRDYVDPLYGCTGCGLCQQHCLHGNDVAAALWQGRAIAHERGLGHPALANLPRDFGARNKRLRETLRRALPAQRFAAEGSVGYLPGCDAVDHDLPSVHDALRVCDALDLGSLRLVDAPLLCAGHTLWAAGQHETARYTAEEMLSCVRRFDTVVLGCAACTLLMRVELPQRGLKAETEVLHLSEYLAPHADRLAIQSTRPAAYYHDPCTLGRKLGVYNPPRQLAARCVDTLHEFSHARELADCCGGGGLVPQTYPEAATGQARRRLDEPLLFEANLVVTACALCKHTLESAGSPIEVVSLVSLIARALESPSPE